MSVLNPGVRVVRISGSNVADGTAVSAVSFVEDPSGYFALRVVDAAPQAYDSVEDAKRVLQGDGLYTTPTHTTVGVTTVTAAALAANAARRYALLQNISGETLYLKFGAAAVAAQGIALRPYAHYEMSAPAGNLYRGAINVIHGGTGTHNLLVTEAV